MEAAAGGRAHAPDAGRRLAGGRGALGRLDPVLADRPHVSFWTDVSPTSSAQGEKHKPHTSEKMASNHCR